MADDTTASTTVAAPVGAVLAVIADLPSYPLWASELKRVEVLDTGADGKPRTARFELSAGGMSDAYTLAYDWAEDGVSWRLAEPSSLQKSQTGSYQLADSFGQTLVTYQLRIDARLPMIGLMRRKIEKRIVEAALEELKKRVESLR